MSNDLKNMRDSHPFLVTSSDVNEICKPLFDTCGIKNFLYSKIYKDGRCIWLCTNSKWIKHFCEMEYYNLGRFEQSIEQYVSGIYLWNGIRDTPVTLDAMHNFDIANGVTIVEKSKDSCEFYHFSTGKNNYSICNFYINNFDILKRFMSYFKGQADGLIKQVSKTSIILPMPLKINDLEGIHIKQDCVINDFYKQITCKKYHLNSQYNNALITRREMDCLYWLYQGKTMEEIGLILNISKRTAINHIEKIKVKTQVNKTSKLLEIVRILGFASVLP
jgi:DNA-binding CsgD family transcriptional regulator